MVAVINRGRSAFRDNRRSTQTALVIAFTHGGAFWRSKARLIDAFLAICLEEGVEFCVHHSPAQKKERAMLQVSTKAIYNMAQRQSIYLNGCKERCY
jgi:hypothetical protein